MMCLDMMMANNRCPCGSDRDFEICCGRYLSLSACAPDAVQLMRSRYVAYVRADMDYLSYTTMPVQRAGLDLAAMHAWATESQWLGLTVLDHGISPHTADQAWVRFEAKWQDATGVHTHQEHSVFVRIAEQWFFVDPSIKVKAGRNDPCPCNSGFKFKKCCSTLWASVAYAQS